jgi:YecR-like lipoprotein
MAIFIARWQASCQNGLPTLTVEKRYSSPQAKKVPEMPRLILFLAAAVALAGCTTYKLWTESGSSEEEGVVRLTYEYRRFESPQVDERAGIEMARDHCKDWGFPDAGRKGEDRQCVDGSASDCSKWHVVREYRCLEQKRK